MTAHFVPHCEEPDCGLGSLRFVCPHCGESAVDYDGWWQQEEIFKETYSPYRFRCDRCDKSLMLTLMNDEPTVSQAQ